MIVAAGVFLGLLASFTIAAIAWRHGYREGRAFDDIVEAHNQRLRVKNRELHERNRVLEARDVEMTAFLAIITPADWETS